MSERYRKIESAVEKVGGGIIAVLGAISVKLPDVALGLALFLIGKWREPKRQNA